MAEGKKEIMVWKLTEEEIQLGFEEEMSLVPSPVVVAIGCNSNSKLDLKTNEPRKKSGRPEVVADRVVPANWKNRSKAYHKARFPVNMSHGGPGMQVVFLDYAQGTGVFLPRRPGIHFQPSYPVFLPCHMVQNLNLSIHVPFDLYRDVVIYSHNNSNNNKKKKKKKNHPTKAGDGKKSVKKAPKHGSSEKIYLPEEWIYDNY